MAVTPTCRAEGASCQSGVDCCCGYCIKPDHALTWTQMVTWMKSPKGLLRLMMSQVLRRLGIPDNQWLGNAEPIAHATELRAATQSIHHSPLCGSAVILPFNEPAAVS